MKELGRYDKRGVSASKDEVHEAVKTLDKGLFPLAFCKILPDFTGGAESHCNIIHADTAGTKPSLAYIYWKETGDLSVWRGIAQDALVMNLDDMASVGMINDFVLSSTIGRNKNLIPGDVIKEIIHGTQDYIELLRESGVSIRHGGGETADVGDIVRSIDVGFTVFGRMPRKDLIVNNIQDGDVIVGFASDGQASYENEYNGGMGSNGLTSARHDVFHHSYRHKYPESYDPAVPADLVYSGSRLLTEEVQIAEEKIPLGKLVLSPTRTYIPMLVKMVKGYKEQINGIIHNTGGAHSKVLRFLNNKKVIKDNLPAIPTLFKIIQEESNTPLKEMYKVFNMGTRLEIYTDQTTASELIDIANSFSIDAQIIGRVESSHKNQVEINTQGQNFLYE